MDSLYDHTRYFEVQGKISTIKSVFPDYFSISYDYGSEMQKSSGVGKGDWIPLDIWSFTSLTMTVKRKIKQKNPPQTSSSSSKTTGNITLVHFM